eukprot:GHVQ01035779.1.p2 GENE.GHVQ01035779.1~~GHVQ01035779.1.p2  ORF type:complete len:209 (+),score=46.08 GHVQ01035779.1:1509-2135(+)
MSLGNSGILASYLSVYVSYIVFQQETLLLINPCLQTSPLVPPLLLVRSRIEEEEVLVMVGESAMLSCSAHLLPNLLQSLCATRIAYSSYPNSKLYYSRLYHCIPTRDTPPYKPMSTDKSSRTSSSSRTVSYRGGGGPGDGGGVCDAKGKSVGGRQGGPDGLASWSLRLLLFGGRELVVGGVGGGRCGTRGSTDTQTQTHRHTVTDTQT